MPTEFYVRVILVPDGAFLDVWGHAAVPQLNFTAAAGDVASPAGGRLGPDGWVQSIVKFASVANAR
jgi:hypothetical protein